MDWIWRAIDYGWFDYLVLVVVGRSVLAWLPPGRVGGSRPAELAATLVVSALLGHAVMAWTFTVGPSVEPGSRWWLAAPWLALGAVRWFTRPHAFVAGHTPPVPLDARGRGPALLALAVATSSPLWWIPDATHDEFVGRAMASVGLALLAVTVLHALGLSRRALAGKTLVAALLVTTPALRESLYHVPTLPAAFVALTCAGLIGWSRRADPRHAALALLGAAASYPASPTTWLAGFAAVVLQSHHHARRRALYGALALFALAILPEFALGEGFAVRLSNQSDLPILAPSLLEALERRELWGLVWYACGFAILASLGGVNGGRTKEMPLKLGEAERPSRELRAVLLFLALAFALHAAERWAPPSLLAEHARPTWLGFLVLMLPAAAIVLGLVFCPGERVAAREVAR
jgi:hypothetical protein